MMRCVCNVLFFVLMLCCTRNSITAQVAYHNFNTNSGLPSNETYCAYQDKQGYMWFGTDHGVVKYNGYTFETYTTADGLTDNTIFSIKGDAEGNIWFLTYSGGICYYNGHGFYPHPMNDSIKVICNKKFPTDWEVLNNHELWLAEIEIGFYKVTSNRVSPYVSNGFEKNGLSKIIIINFNDSTSIYSVFTNKNIPVISDTIVKQKDIFAIQEKLINSISVNFYLLKISAHRLIIAMDQTLLIVSKNRIEANYTLPRDTRLIQLKLLTDNHIWVGNDNGTTYVLSTDSNKIQIIDSVFSITSVSDIIQDKQKCYWMTTLNKGIFMLSNYNVKECVSGYKVNGLFVNDSILYGLLPAHTILKVDTRMKLQMEKRFGRSSAATSIVFKENGRYFTNLDDNLLFKKFFFLKIKEIKPELYIAGGTGGFVVATTKNIIYDSQEHGFESKVTEIAKIAPNLYFLGTLNGAYYFNLNTYLLNKDTFLNKVRITACKVYSNNLYAIATRGNGIYLIINGVRYLIDEKKGLISNLAENLFIENDSTIWVASYKGLSVIKYKLQNSVLKTIIHSYTNEDGLCSNQINDIIGFNGYIWLATNEGVCYFKPADIEMDTLHIPFYFRDVNVNNDKINIDNSVNLKYFQNNLTINFNGLFYKALSGVRYKVKLVGLEEWKYITDNTVQYFNLPAGKYTFQVAAEDKFGRYRSSVNKLNFVVNPSFNNTLLFKILMAIIILIIAGVIIYLFFSYQRFRSQNVIKLLQAEFKALNYQINPHFIFNVLNSIQYYIIRKDSTKAVQFLNSFSQLIRRIVTNSKQPYISVLEEVECLQDYMDLEKLRLDNRFEYEINIDSDINIEEKMMLPMIIQPLVENSIWHGIVPYEGVGKIKVEFYKQNNALVCIVDDNGVGINSKARINKKSENNLSLAMGNVNERLKIIGELNGSEWFINIGDKSDKDPTDHGTVVTIKFPIVKKD